MFSSTCSSLFLISCLIGDCRQQDEELDELSASVERIGGVGLTIHEELIAQVSFYGMMFLVMPYASRASIKVHLIETGSCVYLDAHSYNLQTLSTY